MNRTLPAWIGLGSNIGEGKKILQSAWQRLGELPGITLDSLSRPWRTSPLGMKSTEWFTNAVGRVCVELNPEELLHAMMVVETDFGRIRTAAKERYQDRSLDLDLLYYGTNAEVKWQSPTLKVPHPHASERLFVLLPLQEINPKLYDVRAGSRVAGMIESLENAEEQRVEVEEWD